MPTNLTKKEVKENQRQVKFLDKFRQKIANIRQEGRDSLKKFQGFLRALRQTSVNGNQILSDRSRLINRIDQIHYGHMIMFYYDPKWADKLPYFDRFPLVIPLQPAKGGFLGLNLHYLPPGHRAVLMDNLYQSEIYNPKNQITDETRIRINYDRLKATIRNRYFVPCIKHYLYSHTRSRFFLVPPADWDAFIFLPTERFEKDNMRNIHRQSLLKIRRS